MKTPSRILAFAMLLTAGIAQAQTTIFTYQGSLNQNGAPTTGLQDFEFRLFNAASGGAQQGPTIPANDVGVTNGLFTVALDFGAVAFSGADRWLEIATRPGTNVGTYTTLSPRQAITSTPYAIRAANLTGTLPLSQLPAGVVTNNATGLTLTGIFTGNGAGVTNVNAATLGGLSSAGFWKTNGNAGANPANGAFLGTTDDQPLELKVNGQRAWRLEPRPNAAPNLVAGSPSNSVAAGTEGVTIAGGGNATNPNRVASAGGSIGGGFGNDIQTSSVSSKVSGGELNRIGINSPYATIGGGTQNRILQAGYSASIGGGYQNQIGANSGNSTISGGFTNAIANDAVSATIGGGGLNQILPGGTGGVIGGGGYNRASGYGTVPGGGLNDALGVYSLAAGYRAKANHAGAFVWGDSTEADFSSTANNQFLVRATGGVGVGTDNPQAQLHLYSQAPVTTLRLQSAGGFGAGRIEFLSDPQGSGTEWRPGYIQSTDNGGFTGGLSFHVNGTGYDNRLGDLEVMRILDGRVGINTPNPLAALEVSGGAYADFLSAGGMNTVNLTSTGELQIHNSTQDGDHTFTGDLRQMITLGYSGFLTAGYGLGLQTNNFYFRSEADFSWFRGGSHRDTPYDPGSVFFFPGAELMRLSGGYLSVRGDGDERAYLGGDGAGGDVQLGSLNPGVGAVSLWNHASGQTMDLNARSAGFSGTVSFGAQTRQMLNLWGTQYGFGVQSSTLYSRCDSAGANAGFSWYKGGVHQDGYANAGGGIELMHLIDGGLYVHGTYNNTSDRNAKENFSPVEPRDVLERVVALPITRWNYKHDAATPHLGPVAQDFHAAFGLGPDDKHIATVDESGVALAAIQGLNQKLSDELKRRDAENAELKQRLEILERIILDQKSNVENTP